MPTMLLAVAAGGAIGSVARYLVVVQMARLFGATFPWGTLAVNVVGGLAIGALAEAFAVKWPIAPELRAFLIVGILGGFTTFSAFSLDAITLLRQGEIVAALLYVAGSVMLSITAAVAGVILMRWPLA